MLLLAYATFPGYSFLEITLYIKFSRLIWNLRNISERRNFMHRVFSVCKKDAARRIQRKVNTRLFFYILYNILIINKDIQK